MMKTILNSSSSKAYRRIGKICFIIVLSILVAYYFNLDFSDKADILFTFAVLTLVFVIYELCGVTLGWCLRRIGGVLFAGSYVGGKDGIYPSGVAIPYKLEARLNLELKPMEKIRWIDQPVPRYFTPKTKGYFLFGIPWTAFNAFWTLGAWLYWWEKGDLGAAVPAIFGIPFLLVGLGLLLSPIWAYRKALKTVYVITDRRAIIFDGGHGGPSTTISSYNPEKLQDVYRKEHEDGSGDVIISRREWENSKGHYRVEELGFLRIQNPHEVERILKELAGQKNEGGHPFNMELRN